MWDRVCELCDALFHTIRRPVCVCVGTEAVPCVAAVINAETAAYQSEKFVTMARRTRQDYLRDLAANYLTDVTLEAAPKFCESPPAARAAPGLRSSVAPRCCLFWC